MTRLQQESEAVLALIADGHNDCEVSRRTGVPRTTVRGWRRGRRGHRSRRSSHPWDHDCKNSHDFTHLPARAYSYLLGMYLGDGYLAAYPRGVWRLRIVSDARYPSIIKECARYGGTDAGPACLSN